MKKEITVLDLEVMIDAARHARDVMEMLGSIGEGHGNFLDSDIKKIFYDINTMVCILSSKMEDKEKENEK